MQKGEKRQCRNGRAAGLERGGEDAGCVINHTNLAVSRGKIRSGGRGMIHGVFRFEIKT